jgi:dihydrolipoamide dehydrogenase
MEKFDVAIIGSGPGGYAAAVRCAQRGAVTAVIEKDLLGGTCLNCGCIPSKTLLASAHTLLTLRSAATMGIDAGPATANWPKIQARKEAIVTTFRKGLTGLLQSHKVKIITGHAIVTAPGQIVIQSPSSPAKIQAGRIILATGSKPVEIPNIPFDGNTIISSKETLSLQQIPRSLVIVGGGVIGCEMACVYAAVGTNVTIVEALAQLIPMEDQWVGRLLAREFKKIGIEAITNQKVASVDKNSLPVKVTLESGRLIEAEKVLISVGRRATVDNQTVDALNLRMKGAAIAVDNKMQTSVPSVYAIGDVVGTTFLAHGAFAEAEVAAANATGGDDQIADYRLIPRAVYTFPEVASVGKSEQVCLTEGLDITIGKSFFKANGRSAAHNETVGEIRAIKDNRSGRIVGITMVGANVTELIGAGRVLLGSAEKISAISFPHPSVSEVLKEAVEDAFGQSLHNPPSAIST